MSYIAVLVSDVHLSHTAPSARAAEYDWYAAMARSLLELSMVAGDRPVIIAGDIFDKWNSPPELINFALDQLPLNVYAIPGQHDLPNHRYNEESRSAYGTLVRAGRIKDLSQPQLVSDGLVVHPFPWGFPISPMEVTHTSEHYLNIAVVHSYIWKEGFGYIGADENQRIHKYRALLSGYDVAVFGDNHIGFMVGGQTGRQCILNCGSFFRRHITDLDYKPHVGLLHDDGSVELHYLDVSKDKFSVNDVKRGKPVDVSSNLQAFKNELQQLGGGMVDFREAVIHRLDKEKVSEPIRVLVLEAIGCDG